MPGFHAFIANTISITNAWYEGKVRGYPLISKGQQSHRKENCTGTPMLSNCSIISSSQSSNFEQESAVTSIRAESEHTAFIGSLLVTTKGKHPVFFSKAPIRDSNELAALREMERTDG